jgi:PIN domain nuclease of toxin-antitoxin system
VRILLDTNVLVWLLTDRGRIKTDLYEGIAAGIHEVHVSLVSLWEVAIKQHLGKLKLTDRMIEFLQSPDRREEAGYRSLGISDRHIWQTMAFSHVHRDPFDRLLVAQAVVEGLVLVTGDRRMEDYPVDVLRAST